MIDRYLERIGLDATTNHSVAELHRAHVSSIPYENLDIHLGREIDLGVDAVVAKMVDRRRGGYCFEHNTLFATVLEELGFGVTRCLGRVRMSNHVDPRPATHMTLLVDGEVVDVGFGSANPLGPVPLGGEATYGPYTWRTTRARSPEGEEVWMLSLLDMPLYSFTEAPRHPVDDVTPNHFAATHRLSLFTQVELTERLPDGAVHVRTIDAPDYGTTLGDRFGIDLDDDDVAQLQTFLAR